MTAALDITDLVAGGPDPGLPMELWRLHCELAVDDRVELAAAEAAEWPAGLVQTVMVGAGFDVADGRRGRSDKIAYTRAWSIADTVGPSMRMLIVGLNPSPMASDLGIGFARPGNRFWPAARASGIVEIDRDPVDALTNHGVGMTDLVKRTTVGAKELTPEEYGDGIARLDRLVAWLRPGIVAVVGLSGWRSAVDRTAVAGPQPGGLGGRPVYLMPNPSGLNAHITVDGFARHLRDASARSAAGPPAHRRGGIAEPDQEAVATRVNSASR